MKTLRVRTIGPQTYGTRQLTAGEELDLPIYDAMKMVRRKEARFVARQGATKQVPKPQESRAAADFIEHVQPSAIHGQVGGDEKPPGDLAALRAEAAALGIAVDGRWGVLRLEHEIGRAKRR